MIYTEPMKVEIDQKTANKLTALAAINGTSLETLIARAVAKDERYWREYEEDMASLKDMKAHGGVPHDEMMNWLKDSSEDKNV